MENNIERILFTAEDPLGRMVILKSSTWENHIKDRHSEKGIEQIKNSITNPFIICENTKETNSEKDRQVYFRYTTRDNKLYNTKTVVEFDNDGNGEVVTDYILRKINESVVEGGIVYDCTTTTNTKR